MRFGLFIQFSANNVEKVRLANSGVIATIAAKAMEKNPGVSTVTSRTVNSNS
jgi:hypothetical protein